MAGPGRPDRSSLDAADEYNRLIAADPGAAAEQLGLLHEGFARAGITFGGAPMSSFLRPHFVGREEWKALRDGGRRLLELAVRVARTAFEGDPGRLCEYLGLPAREARWIGIDPGPPDVVLSRLDAFLTPEGPRFIEVNSDAPAGFGYGDGMAAVFAALPVFRAFAAGRRVSYLPSSSALVEAVLAQWPRASPPRVAIVDWADVRTRADQELLREVFRERGIDCCLADPRDLAVRRGRLVAGDSNVDLVYRRGVLAELVAREEEVRPLLEAYRSGIAVFVNSFRCQLSEDKALFALLTDESSGPLLSPEERTFVAGCVPWTRKVEERWTTRDGQPIDLLPHAIERRSELVLKPAHGYGGRAVFVGDETTPADWEKALREGLGAAWVVQERVAIPEEPFPVFEEGGLAFASLKVNANPFYVAGRDVGAVTRVSRSAVINVSAGGGSVPTFVVG